MFVQAVDNKLYQNPAIYGEFENYCIIMEDMEVPKMIMLQKKLESKESSIRRTAQSKLKKDKLNDIFKLKEFIGTDTTILPWLDGLQFAASFNIEIVNKIPVPDESTTFITEPSGGAKYLAWELIFKKRVIRQLIDGVYNDSILLSFVMGKEVYAEDKASINNAKKYLNVYITNNVPLYNDMIDNDDILISKLVYKPVIKKVRKSKPCSTTK